MLCWERLSLLGLLAIILGFLVTGTAQAQQFGGPSITAPVIPAAIPANPALTPEELTNIHVYDGANRGVVNILTRTVSYDRFFMLPSPGEGAGSGSVLDKQGHILTNYHVVEDANKVWVTLPGGKDPYEGEVVGEDPDNDVAVLKINAPPEELFPVSLGNFGQSSRWATRLHARQPVRVRGNIDDRHYFELEPDAPQPDRARHEVDHSNRCCHEPG